MKKEKCVTVCIGLRPSVKDALFRLKIIPDESYNSCVLRLIEYWDAGHSDD